MMVKSREHRLLSLITLCVCVFREGGQDAAGAAVAVAAAVPPPRFFRVACRSWVIPCSVPFGFSFLLLFFASRARTLPPQARSAPGLSRSLLLSYCRSGVGSRIWVYRPFLWLHIGISGWVGSALQTRTI